MFENGLAIVGLALNIVLSLLPSEWRAVHKRAVLVGHLGGLTLLGIGLYMIALSAIPPGWSATMGPKISIVLGVILLVGGLIWQFASPSAAARSAGLVPGMGNNNTLYGNVHPPASIGNGNTIVGPTDDKGNTIIRSGPGGLAIGSGAKAGPGGVSIGAGAGNTMGDVTGNKGIVTQGQGGDNKMQK